MIKSGLDRCLFGVESGVDTILARFNKKTTAEQNLQALRILTAAGVPIRCTYITFDPLMSMEELVATYKFQGRRDAFLKPRPDLDDEVIFDGVHDPSFVAANTTGAPLYDRISYMLVSMECLIGSPYLRSVESAGLAAGTELSMGRRNAIYMDERIGDMSYFSQAWVDRNFSLDYTIKSIEKLLLPSQRVSVARMRRILKDSAYEILGSMLELVTPSDLRPSSVTEMVNSKSDIGPSAGSMSAEVRRVGLVQILDRAAAQLLPQMANAFDEARASLTTGQADVVRREMDRWKDRSGWRLINAV